MKKSTLILSYIATIFGNPITMIAGSFISAAIAQYLSKDISIPRGDFRFTIYYIALPIIMILMTVIWHILFYIFYFFWNEEKIKYIPFKDWIAFFTYLQRFQIIFVPLYFFLQTHNFMDGGEGIVWFFYVLWALVPASIIVFIITFFKLSKYKKFELPKEEE